MRLATARRVTHVCLLCTRGVGLCPPPMRPPAALMLALALLLTGACVAQKGRLYIYCANGTQCNKNLSESGNFCSYIKPGRPLYKAYRPCNYNKTSNKSCVAAVACQGDLPRATRSFVGL